MKEYVLFGALCFGCFCAAQYYDAPALDDYSIKDDFWVNDDYRFEEPDKDINIDNYESLKTQNDDVLNLKDEQSLQPLEETALLQNDDNRSDSQEKDLLDDVEKFEGKIPILNNQPTGDKSDKILSSELEDAVVNKKENTNEVNDDVFSELYDQLSDLDLQISNKTEEKLADETEDSDENIEDVKFEGASIASNQTELDKIVEETQNILEESNSSDMDNIKTFAIEQIPEQSEDTVAKVHDDLHEDLSKLYNTWDKLKSDEENEVPDIFKEISNKNEDANIEQKKININDIIELDENDNEHFDEVDFDQLFDDLTKDMHNVANQTDQVFEENVAREDDTNDIIADVFDDINSANAHQEDETLLETANGNEIVLPNKKKPTLTVKDLSSSERTQLMEQFKEIHVDDFVVDKLKDSNPVIIELEGTEVVTLNSPNYPSPYPTNQTIDWLIEGDGTGIELNVTDFDVNGALGDYVLFKPGGVDESGDKGIIMSYNLDTERKFRFLNVNRMFVRFEAKAGMAFKKGFSFNAKIIFPPKNTTTEEEVLPPSSLLPEARHTLTVYLGGIPYNDFKEIEDDFKGLLADMATLYVNENEIETQNDTSKITRITSTSFCNINWPGFETCVAVTFTVPVNSSADDEEDWRLNENDLRAMWYTYIYMDPFSARLKRMGVEEFQIPNDGAIMTWWMVVGAAVAFCVLTLGIVLWRFSCIEDYTRMRIYSDSDSIINEKRPLDLYPTPHQTLPPLYGDVNYSWPTEKGENTTVDMSGYNNPNFVRDDIPNFESDDEPARDRGSNRNSFAANHKYNV